MILRFPTYRLCRIWHQQDLPLLHWQRSYPPQELHCLQGGLGKVELMAVAYQKTHGREVVVSSLLARRIQGPYRYTWTSCGQIGYQYRSWNIHEPSSEGKSLPDCFVLRFLRHRHRRLQAQWTSYLYKFSDSDATYHSDTQQTKPPQHQLNEVLGEVLGEHTVSPSFACSYEAVGYASSRLVDLDPIWGQVLLPQESDGWKNSV